MVVQYRPHVVKIIPQGVTRGRHGQGDEPKLNQRAEHRGGNTSVPLHSNTAVSPLRRGEGRGGNPARPKYRTPQSIRQEAQKDLDSEKRAPPPLFSLPCCLGVPCVTCWTAAAMDVVEKRREDFQSLCPAVLIYRPHIRLPP